MTEDQVEYTTDVPTFQRMNKEANERGDHARITKIEGEGDERRITFTLRRQDQ